MYIVILLYLLSCSTYSAWGINPKITENNELLVQSFEQFSQWGLNYLGIENTIAETAPLQEKAKSDVVSHAHRAIQSIQSFSGLRFDKRDEGSLGSYFIGSLLFTISVKHLSVLSLDS